MIHAEIEPGICNLRTTVEADCPDGMTVQLHIESECPRIRALAAELAELNAFQELFKPLRQTLVAELAAKHQLHTTCLAPVGILKAAEAAASLALPADGHIKLARVEPDHS